MNALSTGRDDALVKNQMSFCRHKFNNQHSSSSSAGFQSTAAHLVDKPLLDQPRGRERRRRLQPTDRSTVLNRSFNVKTQKRSTTRLACSDVPLERAQRARALLFV